MERREICTVFDAEIEDLFAWDTVGRGFKLDTDCVEASDNIGYC